MQWGQRKMNEYNRNSGEWIEFRPRKSSGRYWAGALGIAFGLVFLLALVFGWSEVPIYFWIPLLLLGVGITAPLLAIAWYFPSMRYLLGRKELVLSFGPLMYDRVPLDAIRSIRRRNLRLSPVSAFRFPGLALLYVDYVEFGRIRMCATSASKRVLLINIGHRLYGITPEDEMGLVQAIRERAAVDIRVSENFNPSRTAETTISR